MADIQPFQSIRYDRNVAGDLAAVITPPYDVITGDEQKMLHDKSPYNSIRLEYGYAKSADHEKDNRYTRAAATLGQWLDQGVLVQDSEKAFYLYEQTYSYKGADFRRRGIMATLKLEPYSKSIVLPHEKTHSGPKADRLALLESCQTQFSPIFGLTPDPDFLIPGLFDQAREEDLLVDIAEESGSRHRLFSLKDEAKQREISRYFSPHPVLIADGHHRYETALYYSGQADLSRSPGSGHIMAVLVGINDPGLLMLPTHRLLNGIGTESLNSIIDTAQRDFVSEHFSKTEQASPAGLETMLAEKNRSGPAFAMVTGDNINLLCPGEKADPDQLALTLLHEKLINPILERLPGALGEEKISYSHEAATVIGQVKKGVAEAGFILDAVPVTEVLERSRRGLIMPQKSTYFYPKLPGGLAFYSLR